MQRISLIFKDVLDGLRGVAQEIRTRKAFWMLLSLKIWIVTYVLDVLWWITSKNSVAFIPSTIWQAPQVVSMLKIGNSTLITSQSFFDRVLYNFYSSLLIFPQTDFGYWQSAIFSLLILIVAFVLIKNIVCAVRSKDVPGFVFIGWLSMIMIPSMFLATEMLSGYILNINLFYQDMWIALLHQHYVTMIQFCEYTLHFFVFSNILYLTIFQMLDTRDYLLKILCRSIKLWISDPVRMICTGGILYFNNYMINLQYNYCFFISKLPVAELIQPHVIWFMLLAKFILWPISLYLLFYLYAKLPNVKTA